MNSFVLEMGRTIGHYTTRNPEDGAPFADGYHRIPRGYVRKEAEQLAVEVIVSLHQDVLVATFAWSNTYLVDLKKVARLYSVEGRTE